MSAHLRQGNVWLVRLDPVVGREISKTRPCVIASPQEINEKIATLVVVPLTSRSRPWPFRSVSEFGGLSGAIAIDQIKAVDRSRLVRHLGRLSKIDHQSMVEAIQVFFAIE